MFCSLAVSGCICTPQIGVGTEETPRVSVYLKSQPVRLPDSSIAAINLASAILECTPLKIPYHLPHTRAEADASQRTGPTQDDYRALGSIVTPLFADSRPREVPDTPETCVRESTRSVIHDLEFAYILHETDTKNALNQNQFTYSPGQMTGVWEGLYRVVSFLSIVRS